MCTVAVHDKVRVHSVGVCTPINTVHEGCLKCSAGCAQLLLSPCLLSQASNTRPNVEHSCTLQLHESTTAAQYSTVYLYLVRSNFKVYLPDVSCRRLFNSSTVASVSTFARVHQYFGYIVFATWQLTIAPIDFRDITEKAAGGSLVFRHRSRIGIASSVLTWQ